VGYPILDLREWNRDVGAYVRAIEQVLIDTLTDFGIQAGRIPKLTGVWVGERKIAAIGVHISRWITSHGFALNVSTDLRYFQYIVPCGLSKPVTSMAQLGCGASWETVAERLAGHFGRVFEREIERTAHDGRSDAPDGREHRRGDADEVAEEARRPCGAGRAAV
jgi:lipoyl(octanoyl) transferase